MNTKKIIYKVAYWLIDEIKIGEVKVCKKCGEEIGNRMIIGDELVGYCKDCNWVNH